MYTMTAFVASPALCGFAQTFRYKQSSLYNAPGLSKISSSSIPVAVMFAAARSAAVGGVLLDGATGHEKPYGMLARDNKE